MTNSTKHPIISFAFGLCCFVLCFLFSGLSLWAQTPPIEKAYIHTDRALYFPGERIWFKVYMADEFNKPFDFSEYLTVQLNAPSGEKVLVKTFKIKDGYSYGDIVIDPSWAGGYYT